MRLLLPLVTIALHVAPAAAALPAINNLQSQAWDVTRDGDLVAFHTSESSQGADLNGDGDMDDLMVRLHDLREGTTQTIGIGGDAVDSVDKLLSLRGNVLAFNVKESRVGADLNGDSDTLDPVLHVFDIATETTTNLGLATPRHSDARINGHRVAFHVAESRQGGTDLNGDGDSFDMDVAHIYDINTGSVLNLGVTAGFEWLGPDLLALWISEFWQGRQDLNGDGDTSDSVLHIYDFSSGLLTNLAVAAQFLWIDDGRLWFWLREQELGADLNGDGDALDPVVHIYDGEAATITNVGIAAIPKKFDETLVAMTVFEAWEGATDFNGDGDANDEVAMLYDVETGILTNLQLAISFAQSWPREVAAFVVIEWAQGQQDLNGDGDIWDYVLHVYDPTSGDILNLGLSLDNWKQVLLFDQGRLVFNVAETRQAGRDLNGDGDHSDRVVHILDLDTFAVSNLGIASDNCSFQAVVLACTVNEAVQGNADLNADGEASDRDDVLHFHDASLDITTNTQLALSIYRPINTELPLDGNLAVFTVEEFLQGDTDFNGDGDAGDSVLHTADIISIFVPDLIERLTDDVDALGLSPGLHHNLIAQLNLALAMLTDAVESNDPAGMNALHNFIDAVENGRGGEISEADADALVAAAAEILARLDAQD